MELKTCKLIMNKLLKHYVIFEDNTTKQRKFD